MFISVKFMREIYDLSRINPWGVWNGCFKQLRSWLRIILKLPVWPRLTGSSFCGETQLCYVTELLILRTPKPTSFLIQCYVWVVSVTDQWKPGQTESNGIWKRVISKIWIESMESRWSSSGQISQDSSRWSSSRRFKRWWLNYSVNQSILKEGSSACQCTMTLYGRTRKQRQLHCEFCQNYRVCSQILARTLVISGTRIREEMVWNPS